MHTLKTATQKIKGFVYKKFLDPKAQAAYSSLTSKKTIGKDDEDMLKMLGIVCEDSGKELPTT